MQQVQPGNMFARGGIFDEGPPFGNALDQLRMPGGQNTAGMGREGLQVTSHSHLRRLTLQ